MHYEVRKFSKIGPETAAIIVILVLSFALRLSFLHVPLEVDEGVYAAVAKEILRGAVLYKDVIDVKPPGIYFLYAFILRFVGDSPESIRLFTDFYSLLTTWALYRLGRDLYGTRAGLIAALLYGFFSAGPRVHGSGNNCEVFLALPVIAALHLFWRFAETENRLNLVLSGLCAGVCVLIKPTALPYALLLLVSSAAAAFHTRRQADGVAGVCLTAGKTRAATLNGLFFLAPVVVLAFTVCLYFAFNKALSDLVYWNTEFSKVFGSPDHVMVRMVSNGRPVVAEQLLLFLIGVPTAIGLVLFRRDFKAILVASLVPVSFACVALPRWFSPHYFFFLVPALSLLSGIGLAALSDRKKWFFYPVVGVAAVSLLYSVWIDYKYFLVYSPDEVITHMYPGSAGTTMIKLGQYLQQRTSPNDYLYLWGRSSDLYYYARRRAPNPFMSYFYIGASRDPKKSMRQFVKSLVVTKPRYVIIEREGDPGIHFEEWPGYLDLQSILTTWYDLEQDQEYVILYRLKSAVGG